ncbi:MAG TPA: 30S ribosomal protein S17 [Bacilli bacterium]|nr:MAG: 30S ribosomal protein S17 [Tenericutes bacterium ADurb.BinA124]HNZ50360.1 30S ribosomal protein S17 [Bacilli bacterium]HPX84070.1 30S ribosomal protein S17 [Bacilli bacterium]HQC74080.1 30S ribosomal protein S17 [Bacilli bacterium]
METTEKKIHREYIGKVVSDKADKTIKVLYTTFHRHPLYGKRVEVSKKLTAHDEKNEAKIGDTVRIVETRPLSKTKHFRLLEVIERAEIV